MLRSHNNTKASSRVFSIGDVQNAKDEDDIKTLDKSLVIRVKDGATKSGDSTPNMLPSNLYKYMDEGINIIKTYGYGASGSDWKKEGELPIAADDMIWSWAEFEPSIDTSNGSAVVLSTTTNRMQVASSQDLYRPACRRLVSDELNRVDSDWIIGDQVVAFEDAEAACLLAGGNEYYFATPRNKMELNALIHYRDVNYQGDEFIWLNYAKTSGVWVADIGEADSEMEALCESSNANICSKIDDFVNLTNASTDF